ncbi:hypothetical protein MHYP_G00246540 [Metynnis hypsauchen]
MEHNLFHLLCLTGVLPVALSVLHSVPHIYHLITTTKTWSDAQTYCRDKYEDLATVISTDDWTKLQKEKQNYGFSALAWVGLYNDYNSWRWSFKNTTLMLKKWSSGEPNNQNGNESCGALDTYGYWWDLNCLVLKPFLCYNASYSGRFINIYSTMMTWYDAQAYCRQYHTDLATVDNETDNQQLKSMVIGQWSAWFGLFRDTWKWSDQSNASSINWLLGSPDNYGGNENCGLVNGDYITDASCSNLLPFFCHNILPVREKQIVQLYVKSDRNVADPAVESSILDLIQQELKINGMADNTTLTWRLQPDGKIFHKAKEKIIQTVDNTTTEVCNT